jgi:excisionase family DNA binding protein
VTGTVVAQYLTPAQVAELLQVSEKTVSRWSLQDASMPTVRIGRVVRFEREALLAWLRRRQPRGSAQRQRKDGPSVAQVRNLT